MSDYQKEPIAKLVEAPQPKLRLFIVVFFTTSILISVTLVLLSIYSNHYGYFGSVGQFPAYNGRYAKVEYLRTLPENQMPDAWIIGSSSTLPFQPKTVNKLFSVKNTFNLGSFWGRAEDFWAWSNFMLRDLNTRPKLVILGVEPWTFSEDRRGPPLLLEYRRRLIVTQQLAKYLPKFSWLRYQSSKILDSLTLQNFQIMMRMFKRHKFSRSQMASLGSDDGPITLEGTSKGYNGQTPRKFLPNDVYQIYKSNDNTGAINLNELSPDRLRAVQATHLELRKVFDYLPGDQMQTSDFELFKKTIELFQSYNINIAIIILPTHPYLFDQLIYHTKHAEHLARIRRFLNNIQNENDKVRVIYDASHITKFGGDPYDFHDHLHMTPKNTDRILRRVRQQMGAL